MHLMPNVRRILVQQIHIVQNILENSTWHCFLESVRVSYYSTGTELTVNKQCTSRESFSYKQPCLDILWHEDCDKGIMGLYSHPILNNDCPNQHQRGPCDAMEKGNF